MKCNCLQIQAVCSGAQRVAHAPHLGHPNSTISDRRHGACDPLQYHAMQHVDVGPSRHVQDHHYDNCANKPLCNSWPALLTCMVLAQSKPGGTIAWHTDYLVAYLAYSSNSLPNGGHSSSDRLHKPPHSIKLFVHGTTYLYHDILLTSPWPTDTTGAEKAAQCHWIA